MIYGTVACWQRDTPFLPAAFDKAFAFLAGKKLTDLPDGRYDIAGNDLFALVQAPVTAPESTRPFEAHATYCDIQLLIAGEEKQLYTADSTGVSLTEDALSDRDLAFFTRPSSYNSVTLTPMTYAVYFPGELHAPNCDASVSGCPLKKIVFKIHRDIL